ncbi:MAG: hypothetical protein LCH41_12700 [Armatimonadetes bacterium]|nr:hypothetical protein [Armatimonadota bacterium]
MAMKPKGVTILVKVYCGLFLVVGVVLIGLMAAVVGLAENGAAAFDPVATDSAPATPPKQQMDADTIKALKQSSWIPFPIFLEETPTQAMRTVLILGVIMLIPLILILILPASKFAWWMGLFSLLLSLIPGILLIPGVVLILLWCQASVRKHHKFKTT